METASNSTDLTQSPIKSKEENSEKNETVESKDSVTINKPNKISLSSEEPKPKLKNNKSKKGKKEFPKPNKKYKSDDTSNKDKDIAKEKNNDKKEKVKVKENVVSSADKDKDSDNDNNSGKKVFKDIIIELGEDIDSSSEKKEKKKKNKKESKNSKNPEAKNINSVISGYNAFIFYEKEKFKAVNCKEINVREYVSKISSEWRNMSEKDKEPYVKMALDFKNNHKLPTDEKGQLLTKKRKRKAITKEKKESNKIKKEKLSDETKLKKASTSAKKIKNERKGSDDEDMKNNDNDECMNHLIYSVFAPFVEKAYDYFNSKGIIKPKI